jgi:hypothetical protein
VGLINLPEAVNTPHLLSPTPPSLSYEYGHKETKRETSDIMSDAAAMDRGGNERNTPGGDSRYPELDVGDTFDIGDEPIGVAAGAVRHQGSRLPKPTKCDLSAIEKLSSTETDPTEWMMQVEDTLEIMLLGDLINLSLPRPEIDDPSYRIWSYWSASVGRWIGLQVDKDTRTRLSVLAERPKMADVLFDELVSYTREGERSDKLMIDIYKLADMKREHFSSAGEYITSYQRQISVLRRVKLAPLPFHAIAIILREVEEELPGMAFMKEALQKVVNPQEMTQEEFDRKCKEMLINARQLAISISTNKVSSAREKSARQADRRTHSDRYDYADRGRGRGGYNRGGQRGRGRGGGGNNGSSHEEHADRGSSYTGNSTGIASARNAPPKGNELRRSTK